MDSPPRLGGFTEIARELEITRVPRRDHEDDDAIVIPYRQMIYTWWKRRRTTGFPEHVSLTDSGRKQFDLDAVRAWYERYEPARGGRPHTDTRPQIEDN